MNDKGVYRTAPATQGMLISLCYKINEVEGLSPMSLHRCVSVSVVEFPLDGLACNMADPHYKKHKCI